MPSDSTVHLKGASSVPVKSIGHEKNHFTVVLTAQADGTKSKPFVVFKGKGTRLIKDLQKIKGIHWEKKRYFFIVYSREI